MSITILFIKNLPLDVFTTEVFAERILNDPKYDNHPLIDKKQIVAAFDRYGSALNPANRDSSLDIANISFNIEGHFLAGNVPEIRSVVVDGGCTKGRLVELLAEHTGVTHVGLTVYASGMHHAVQIVDFLQNERPDLKLFAGGVGVVYLHIRSRVPAEDICVGEGVAFLRKKFGLKPLSREEYRIPDIVSEGKMFPVPYTAHTIVTQIGCHLHCDFCITAKFHRYLPLASAEKIISCIEQIAARSAGDAFINICDANAFNPPGVWQKVFDHFIENPRGITKNIFLCFLSSLNVLNRLPLERIQRESPLKLLFVNYGIEKTVDSPYSKNNDNPKEVIRRLNALGIITLHNYIIGLPDQTEAMIDEEIRNNLEYGSDMISVSTFKPIPITPLYDRLASEGRIYGDELPLEFLYPEGFLPFNHQFLGGGFSILAHAFKAYVETEKALIDKYDTIANRLLTVRRISGSGIILEIAKKFNAFSAYAYTSFKNRMPDPLSAIYLNNMTKTSEAIAAIERP